MKNEQSAAHAAESECGKFKIELRGVGKRVVVMPVHITLLEVHEVVQRLFGWDGGHLWEFMDAGGRRYGESMEVKGGFSWNDDELISPTKVCLSDVLPEREGKLRYTYDFGDGWAHVITRMADPKTPGLYCVQTEGPDGIEDVGGVWGLWAYKKEWHVPDVAEITARLRRVRLKPRKQGTGLLRKEAEELEALIRGLSGHEWAWLCQLGEEGMAGSERRSNRIERLARLLPGVEHKSRLSFLLGGHVFEAEPEFRRFWRKKKDEWARMRAEAGSLRKAKAGRNDPCPHGSGKKSKKCLGKGK